MARLFLEWGMTKEDERLWDHNGWRVTQGACSFIAGPCLSSLSVLTSLKAASTAWSHFATVRVALAGLPFLLPVTAAVASALTGAYYGAALWTQLSEYQERRACLRLNRHSSLLFRFARRELGLYPARAADDEWLPD